jgi:hypothetical protein
MLLCLFVVGGCTSTAPVVTSVQPAAQPLALSHARVAVLSFANAPDHPDTGQVSREVTMALLVQRYEVALVSPSKADLYLKEHSISLYEYDLEALKAVAQALEADVVLWGSINQFTPYKFDRLAPATPPYVDVTLYGFRLGDSGVAKITGRKQGGIPATIWNRQPTFTDVAQPLIAQLLLALR